MATQSRVKYNAVIKSEERKTKETSDWLREKMKKKKGGDGVTAGGERKGNREC
ncbi:hypothetical protein COLO4_10404 [Corchorus olitorius]|uniref:Uncharacterized protein n=1 Tax=Corchorus olitorius TaxID=93759 RepID=A0A1R3K8Q9_9ROSI|nr:hypothetical protein COLO4_10404 [Corchorus olitorius]